MIKAQDPIRKFKGHMAFASQMVTQTSKVNSDSHSKNHWMNYRIGITGAKGSLGRALTKEFRDRGAVVIGLTHGSIPLKAESQEGPQEWVNWKCGEEESLKENLKQLDILILNHGINPQGSQTYDDINKALEINALSSWRLIENFQEIANKTSSNSKRRELWINTSEAEIQPALSPAYEISKRLIGQLVSIRWSSLNKDERENFIIRKLILGPFKSDLNPIGIMTAKLVAKQILTQAELKIRLIIVTPNPITYILMPIVESFRFIYSRIISLLIK